MRTLGITALALGFLAASASAGNLAVHLDAGQISSSPADGEDVTQWDDLALYWGVNNAVQTVSITGTGIPSWPASNPPQFVASSLSNGLPGVSFSRVPDANGSQEGLCMDDIYTPGWIDTVWGEWYDHHTEPPGGYTSDWNASGTFTSATGVAVLYVDELPDGGSGAIWDFSPFGVGDNHGYQDKRIFDSFGATSAVEIADNAPGLTSPHIYIVNVQADGTKTVYLNGVQISQMTITPDFSVINPTIGCDNPLQGASGGYGQLHNALGGVINEVQIFEGDMALAELEAAGSALAAKYGIDWTAIVTQPACHTGDANGDGEVGIADLSALADNYGATGATWKMGDFNDDGEVGIADLSALADNYGWTGDPCDPDAMAVPEPATLGLLALSGLAALIRRR